MTAMETSNSRMEKPPLGIVTLGERVNSECGRLLYLHFITGFSGMNALVSLCLVALVPSIGGFGSSHELSSELLPQVVIE